MRVELIIETDYENIATPASADNISIGTNAHSLVSFGLFKRGATAELKKYSEEAYKGYKFVNLKYNNAKDAVTISGGENIDNAFIAPKTAAARILSLTLQQAKTA